MSTPASQLTGLTLNKRWEVVRLLHSKSDQTGGCFSCQYETVDQRTGRRYFLKAIDLFKKASAVNGNFLSVLQDRERSLRNFRYESRLLETCEEHGMNRIVRAVDTGIHQIPIPNMSIDIEVPYIVFELAEGDLRTHPSRQTFDLGWRLTVFHGIAAAAMQLHSAGIAHQDLKPSNVLVFRDDFAKIGDLGRATRQATPSAYEVEQHIGDQNYIPFELLYGQFLPGGWNLRRLGADLFMLGSILTYLVTDSSFLVLTLDKLDRSLWPSQNRDYQAVIPHIQRCVESVLEEIKKCLPPELADDVCSLVYRLCDPDYTRRGWPHMRSSDGRWLTERTYLGQYDLQQVVSASNSLARKATMRNHRAASLGDTRQFLPWFTRASDAIR